MGLDMYLDGDKYLALDFDNPDNTPTEDGYRLTNRTLRLGYWRKHPNLHGYIVNTFADGIDQCQRIDLSENDIEKIIDAVARDDLPHTEGFFFGASDGSEREETLRIFRDALQWLRTTESNVFRSIYYQASW
ncbi:MAG: hypothetical protein KC643_28915 [Nitrospira sp.]|nr:hypothetical protein [Nitrospira sp.]